MDTNAVDQDKRILELSIKALTMALDKLTGACMDVDGKPQAPSYKALMEARGALPGWCTHSFKSPTTQGIPSNKVVTASRVTTNQRPK